MVDFIEATKQLKPKDKPFLGHLQAEQPTGREKTQVKQQFFDTLPPRFDKQKALATAQTLGISASTAERQLQKWCVCGKLCHPKHGEYSKPK